MHDTRIARQVLRPEVLGPLRAGFRLDWHGIHGLPHWARVLRYGLAIASREGADPWVVAWFAVLHDHQRNDEGPDRGHGPRAADALASIAERGWLDGLDAGQRDRLAEAIRHHSEGWTHPDPSIGTCWDADRLDLARLGIATAPELLSTRTARRMVDPEAWGGIAPMRAYPPRATCERRHRRTATARTAGAFARRTLAGRTGAAAPSRCVHRQAPLPDAADPPDVRPGRGLTR
ncbi:hypothetical protein [Silanimonas lenta]|uniref:hypothetical protein n=1 Tax=Silanimonas lenta TaxID=265429 RepID=UPI0012EC4ED5|nr:hypothetical protein [Silanimonas lenta]